MIEINKNKLIPGIVATWGDITGNISNQSDLVEYISSHGGGNAEWGSISGNISDQSDLMDLVSSYATESWVEGQGYLTSVPSEYAEKSWVEGQGYLTSVPSGYATESWVEGQGYLTSVPSGYATESWVEGQGYATESWVSSQQFVTSSILTSYATQSWVEGQGYLSSIPSEYAEKSWVESQGYVSVEELSAYALISDSIFTPLNSLRSDAGWDTQSGTYTLTTEYHRAVAASAVTYDTIGFDDSYYGLNMQYVYDISGSYYYCNPSEESLMYVYKSSINYFDRFASLGNSVPTSNAVFWSDFSGNLFYGKSFLVEFQPPFGDEPLSTVTFTHMGWTSFPKYYTDGNKHNIFYGKYGVYGLSLATNAANNLAYVYIDSTIGFSKIASPTITSNQTWYKSTAYFNGDFYYQKGGSYYKLVDSDPSISGYYISFELSNPLPSMTYLRNGVATNVHISRVFHITTSTESYYAFVQPFVGETEYGTFYKLQSTSGEYEWVCVSNLSESNPSLFAGNYPQMIGTSVVMGVGGITEDGISYQRTWDFNGSPAVPSSISYMWTSETYNDIQSLFNDTTSLLYRVSSIESTLGSAVDITNNILGY